jgi:hypothetical protein
MPVFEWKFCRECGKVRRVVAKSEGLVSLECGHQIAAPQPPKKEDGK